MTIDYQPDFHPGQPWLVQGPPTGAQVPRFGTEGGHHVVDVVAYQVTYATFDAALAAHPGARVLANARGHLQYDLDNGRRGHAYLPTQSPTGYAQALLCVREDGEWRRTGDCPGACNAAQVLELVPTEAEALAVARRRWRCS